ncbi:MAG: 23S rRNA (pseudouridine(1915)-N(3))-methyltransferase RlmH [Muribaculaceae bacterium]|nr:23S rRNA (pseudouridine(1915)-N(3))-methyltransferase RlmH [Muribaculaceae bacterium]
MKIVIIAVGKTSTPYIATAVDDYLRRASHHVPVEMTIIPDLRSPRGLSEDAQKQREGKSILAALQPGDLVTLLDERGAELNSRQFAAEIERAMVSGLKRIVYVIGGPYGFSKEVYDRSDRRLSLSRMTFTHEMVRLFFAEQVYRATTIMRGEPYHHD